MLDKNKVINIKFTRRGKGYDTLEVDDFLDEIVAGIEEIEQENASSKRKLEEDRQSLLNALAAAQTLAKDVEHKARAEAEFIIHKSRSEAEEYIKSVEMQYSETVRQINRLRQFYDSYRAAVLKDMDSQRETFLSGFLSESVYADLPGLLKDAPSSDAGDKEYASEDLVLDTSELSRTAARPDSSDFSAPGELNYFGLGANETPVYYPEQDTADERPAYASTERPAPERTPIKKQVIAEPSEIEQRPSVRKELDTGNMGAINLEEIISGLPQTDDELKALIDEIM